MIYHRFIRAFDLSQAELRIDDPDLLHQWQHVLRFKPGENIILCNGRGREADAELIEMTKKGCLVRLSNPRFSLAEAKRTVTLYFSPLKRENTELILQKATELGVVRFVPLRCRRTIKQEVKRERLDKILIEAAEQSGRGVVPLLEEMQDFTQVIRRRSEITGNSFFFELGAEPFVPSALPSEGRVNLFIGPEGGWDPIEIQSARDSGCLILGLGATTLRAETAAIVACGLVLLGESC